MLVPSITFAALLSLLSSSPQRADATAAAAPTPAEKVKAASVDDVAEITGYYVCKGQEAGGKKYSGVAVISKKGDVYLVQWMIGSGSTFSGIGIRQGSNLAVSWAIPNERGMVRGVNLYRIDAGPRLSGRWATVPGPGVLQSETLTYLKSIDEDD